MHVGGHVMRCVCVRVCDCVRALPCRLRNAEACEVM